MSMPGQDVARSYDEVPYDAGAIPGLHPDRLAVAGRLWGIVAPPVETARVLELGCGTGENLLALAVALPDATFVGIDASPRQVEMGAGRAAALGLANVRIECRRIEELDAEPFDFILCHGVFSWVERRVQERILRLCADALAPDGLAYISYNTMPGWHLRQQLRNMLLFHVHERGTAAERVAQARAFLGFLHDALAERTDAYGVMLRAEAASLHTQSDAYICHEFLEDANFPEYFHEFVARAASHGLRYLDEAIPASDPPRLTSATRNALATGGADRVGAEQYLDFLAGRPFRRSVLCRTDAPREATVAPGAIRSLRVSAAVAPERDAADLVSDATEAFRFPRGQRIETNHPVMKTALATIGSHFPRSLRFDELCVHVAAGVGEARALTSEAREPADQAQEPTHEARALPDEARDLLAAWLHQCYRAGLVDLHTWEPAIATPPIDRPRASPLARAEAVADSPIVTSLRHASVALHPFDRALLALCDGSQDRSQLADRMRSVEPPDVGAPLTSVEHVHLGVQRLARTALLLR